jgi:glycine/betaine/sarcosine/D-proline reductase family selenoprotein B
MPRLRVIHYVNQFFAGLGSEDKADTPVGFREGPVGPGKRLQALLGEFAEIVATVYCGDNYFASRHDEALKSILQIARSKNVNLLIAGPAFASGRYGFACIEVCHFLTTSLGLDCVTAMHPENPGVEMYMQYKDRRVFAFPATEVVSGMEDALSKMARFASKLNGGLAIGPSSKEGYIPRGFRLVEVANKSGAERAVDMLVTKLAGHPFVTEIPVESLEKIPVPPRIANLADICLAIVTTTGVIPPGNPAGFRNFQNTKWAKYSIEKLESMIDASWDVIHGGYNTEFMRKNPNYGVPLDVLREMEREGRFKKLYPYYYVTPGTRGLLSAMHRFGREMALDMKAGGVDAAVLVSS